MSRICKDAGIERFTCHAFRATFATRFIEQRPHDYKVLQEILGHANIKITLNLYTHVMKDSKVRAMEDLVINYQHENARNSDHIFDTIFDTILYKILCNPMHFNAHR
ncbi:MAG: tyrosine-type recombinase/integrase [Parasporobacterium sp.]|nr:tyrosine-type recombinase/integrase [Parasporobacterium sp.]